MSTHKHMDRVCAAAAVLSLLLTLLFMNGKALGLQSTGKTIGYEDRLFDTSRVHTIDIVMDDWEGFIETCQSEEYSACSVVIDGESYKNVGIRGKGNTSLSSVAQMGSSRYSFKIEFDQYDSTRSYHGLDKLSLNNLIQDNTMLKDYLTYQMMNAFGVASPLSSFVFLTVNGEDWGLYLAVEAVEEAFLQRNYGSGYGELYKPDSMSFGGGRGNGRDFDFNDFAERSGGEEDAQRPSGRSPGGADLGGFDPSAMFGGGGFSFGGASDVKLQYIDDDPDSYANIFDNAKTDVSKSDRTRLIASLKRLSAYEDLENVLDLDAVLRYFVVHNYVVNGDSYTGNMIHNYYLYEEDGRLSMIPWDYNLAFGTFMGGAAGSSVNDAIDDALSDRPMQAWIFSDETYTQRYHALYAEFLDAVDPAQIIDSAYALIAGYVEQDPTKFCTYEEFETGVQTLKSFCALRTESIRGQLAGAIPSTSQEQNAQQEALVSTDGLDLSAMGTMGGGMGGGPGGGFPQGGGGPGDSGTGGFPAGNFGPPGQTPAEGAPTGTGGEGSAPSEPGQTAAPSQSVPQAPEGFDPSGFGQNTGGDRQPPGGGGSFPGGAQEDSGTQAPVLLAVSVLVLAAGLIAAFRFKRR